MNTGHKILIPLAIIFITYCILESSGTECETNLCPNNNKCFVRNVPNQPSYVCECTRPGYQGYDCTQTLNNQIIETCYGEGCKTGSYESPGYTTTGYSNNERVLVLLYIPWATEIRFSFAQNFQIERNADELFVGSGLYVPHSELAQGNALNPRLYFFDGFRAPSPFSVYNDTAFVYFVSDREQTYAGFNIFWNATVADPPSTVTDMTTQSAASATVFKSGLVTTVLITLFATILAQM
ncbi:uncharacterized protein LOC110979762 isoform X2 [Acanthaster planci]|uniref:Uncharacterized protein LOC110979762 isoform X2 n=1 Tax=Acanthaster planci TaxID=133434 RepID=A0A8B7YIR6_ACAPL|nr:uncharacterized protein LOC110979762 isoform X2 [Acanthaster planci]